MQPSSEPTTSVSFGFQAPSFGVQPSFGFQSNVEAPISIKECDEEIINKVNTSLTMLLSSVSIFDFVSIDDLG